MCSRSVIAALALLYSVRAEPTNPGTVILPFGAVNGNVLDDAVEFLGLPYAAPPERFTAPQPWTDRFPGGQLQATRYTPQCWQMTYDPSLIMSEDCLHLNIYAPRTAASKSLPAMVWLHGGGLATGSAMLPLYNASRLAARQQVIVVAANYRLNVFGFGVTQEGGRVSANNGLLDQQEALRWVRSHIAAFGGDAATVTLFGQSGGGKAVGMHVLIPGSKGLFDRAIMESGYVMDVVSVEDALGDMATLATTIGCEDPTLECLRAANASALAEAGFLTPKFPIVVDGHVVPSTPRDLIDKGVFNRIPFMLGSNFEEGNLFMPKDDPVTPKELRCIFEKSFNASMADDLMELYGPVAADSTYVLSQFITDMLFACEARNLAGGLVAHGASPWVYSFRRQPACGAMFPGGEGIAGAVHGAELAYVFQNLRELAPKGCSAETLRRDLEFADLIAGLWTTFARTGRAPWPDFSQRRSPVAVLDVGIGSDALDTQTGFRNGQCALLDATGVPGMAVHENIVMYLLAECQNSSEPSMNVV